MTPSSKSLQRSQSQGSPRWRNRCFDARPAFRQLTGSAGEIQQPRAELGLVVNMGGATVASYTSVLETFGV